jgi:hypothetical protein
MSHDRLERWYRRLLWAYPKRFRRARGPELLTTLLDAARPGQQRPRWRDAVNVLVRGLGCRLAVPRGAGYVTAAVVVALFGGFLASVGLVWTASSRLPELGAAAAVARVAVPAEPSDIVVYDDVLFLPPEAPRGFEPSPGRIQVTVPAVDSDVARTVADSRSRLAADGWRVGELTTTGPVHQFWAARQDDVVRVVGFGSVTVDVHKRVPGWRGAGVAGAAAVGLVGGWLLAGWALHGFRRHRLGGRAAMLAFGVPGVLGALIPVGIVATGLLRTRELLYLIAAVPFAAPAAIGLLAAAGVAAAAPRTPPAPGPTPVPVPARAWQYLAWGATAGHLTFALGWAAVVAIYLVVKARTGDAFLGDPKDVVPWGHDILTLLFIFGFLLSPALLAVSVPLLVTGRRQVGVTWTLLFVAAVTAVALPVLMFSPLGQSAGTWWMD